MNVAPSCPFQVWCLEQLYLEGVSFCLTLFFHVSAWFQYLKILASDLVP